MSLRFLNAAERIKFNRMNIGLPLHALFFDSSDFKTSVSDEHETEWIHFTNNCIEDLESPERSHFLFLLMRINAGKNCMLYGVKEIFKNYLVHLEKKDERDFINLMLQEMLFYAVENLPADAENDIPAKSSFELALEYGFKNTAKEIFYADKICLPYFLPAKLEMLKWLIFCCGGHKKL